MEEDIRATIVNEKTCIEDAMERADVPDERYWRGYIAALEWVLITIEEAV